FTPLTKDPRAPETAGARTARLALAYEHVNERRCVAIKTEDQARAAAQQLSEYPTAAEELRDLSGLADAKLVAWTTEQLFKGQLRIVWRAQSAAPKPPPKPPPPPPKPKPKPGPAPEKKI